MSQLDQYVETSEPISALMAGHSAHTSGSPMDWVLAKPGIFVKTLYKSPDHAHRTLLFRLEPGARSALHSHESLEQIYVLYGSFHDGTCWLRAGDHCVRPAGAKHSAWSESGATVLVIYTPAHPS
jgi:anti-sigma factor ChrR (cupin superfamily)